jgi:hypothetical protein
MISTRSLPSQSVRRFLNTRLGIVRPGHRLDRAEEARKALDLALHVLLAALEDELVGRAAGDDVLRAIRGSTEHADRVVVRQHDVADRLVGDFADAPDHVLRHHRRGLRVDHHDRVVADDDAGVGVALGRVGVRVIGQLVEADLLLDDVGMRRELLRAHWIISALRASRLIRTRGGPSWILDATGDEIIPLASL